MRKIALAVLGIAALVSAPPVRADVDGLAPFVGTWGAHEEGLVIQPSGDGHLDYEDLSSCPSCSMASAPRGAVDFTLTSVSNNTASGSVTAASDPQNDVVGESVTATLVPAFQGPGQLLQMSMGRMQNWEFCNNTSVGQCGS